MSNPAPFYFPGPSTFEHPVALDMYTGYAASLVDAGLERSFPSDPELRAIAVELLTERHSVEDLAADPRRIADAIVEAVEIRRTRRS
jgi:hypothetical protein